MSEESADGYAVFGTALGQCGISWNHVGITGVAWPEHDAGSVRARIGTSHPGAVEADPPPGVRLAMDAVTALLRDGTADFAGVALDLDGVPDFYLRVYEITSAIPPGSTLTYGEIAGRLGMPGSSRAVGQALGRNPVPIIVPCHRVLAADGRIGGFSAPGGVSSKHKLLDIERARSGSTPTLFDL